MPLIIQRASAGSGKTEQLARRYLQILLEAEISEEPLDPTTILAATFTREAAGEILARIFRIVALACLHQEACQKIVEGTTLPIPTQAACQVLLRRLVEFVPRLAIGTIDALFARQARSLALDLGLPPYWEMADTFLANTLARNALLELLEHDPHFSRDWKMLHHFHRRFSFIQEASALLEKNYFIADTLLLEKVDVAALPPQKVTYSEVMLLGQALAQAPIPSSAQGKPNGHWVKALEKLQEAFLQPLYLKDILGLSSLFSECLEEEPRFYSKEIPEAFLTLLRPWAEASLQELRRLALLREGALHRLAKRYQQHRQKASFQAGKYTFGEIERVIVNTPEGFSQEEIEFRMEARVEHLLLDEYQDTSQRQHHFLSPLIGNVLAKGGHAFVVGDVKQGIYGWRGGKRHLLESLEKEYPGYLQKRAALHQSYRSSQAVLNAVNHLFMALRSEAALARMEGGTAFEKAAASWSLNFEPQQGATSVASLKGSVELHEVALSAGTPKEESLQEVVQKTVTLVQEHRLQDPLREIAILVRRTKFIPQLLLALRQKGILASGEGGNPLADTLAVELLLSFLSWSEHSGNSAAYEHLKSSPLRGFLDTNGLLEKNGAARLRALFMNQGYAAILRQAVSFPPFQAALSSYEKARTEQLIAMAHRFEGSGGGLASEFVKRVRQERVESPLSQGVRILTMHASKGLEFESVILMDLDSDLFATIQEGVRIQTTAEGKTFIQTSRDLMTLQGRADLLEALQEEQWSEALSLLYVAMTRAISFLDIVILEAKISSKKSMAAWLRASHFQPQKVEGLSWREQKRPSASEPVLEKPSFFGNKILATSRPKLVKRSPSEGQAWGHVPLAQKFQEAAGRDYGTLQHALLALFSWLEEPFLSPEELLLKLPLAHQGAATLAVAKALLKRFNTDQKLRAVFDPNSFLERWHTWNISHLEVWCERRFAVVLKQERHIELLSGTFDRVILGYREEKEEAIIAQIIDFKTGAKEGEEQRLLEQNYLLQLEDYRKALQKLHPMLEHIETTLVWI